MVDPDQLDLTPLEREADEDASRFWIATGISAGLAAIVFAWGAKAWWGDGGTQPFSLKESGAFGHETYAGGSDKAGHAYSNYLMVHIGAVLYRALGMSDANAAWFSTVACFLVSNWVEVVDGFTEFGFEYGDVLANSAGIALGAVTKLFPIVEDSVGFRLGYVPSNDFLENDKTLLKWVNDYSGMLFFLDVKLRGLLTAFDEDPGMLRFLLFGVVYGTDQYSPVRRNELRRRSLGFHVGLDFAEIIRWQGDYDEGVIHIADIFDYYAVPFFNVAIMRDLNNDEWLINFGVSNRFEIGL